MVHLAAILIWQFGEFGFDRQILCPPTLIIVKRFLLPVFINPILQTKCPPICITFQFTKLKVRQMYCVYSIAIAPCDCVSNLFVFYPD